MADAQTALLVPMVYRGDAVGVLAAFDRGQEGAPFDADDELTVTLSPEAEAVEGGRSWYKLNQSVKATAAPSDAAYAFASWTGGPVTPAAGAVGGAVG